MNTSNWTETDCPLGQTVLSTWYFDLILLMEFLLGITAAIENVILLACLCRLTVFHLNLRCLLGHLSFVLLWFSAGHSFKAIHMLLTSICDQTVSARQCKIRELFVSAMPAALTVYTLVSLCFERLYASLKYRTYDFGKSRKPWLACALICTTWAAGLAATVHVLLHIPLNKTVDVRESTLSATGWDIGNVLVVSVIFEVTSALMVTLSYLYNRFAKNHIAINRAIYDLSSRFQVNQNAQLDTMILPSIALHVLCFVPNVIFLLLIFIGTPLEFDSKVLFVHMSYLWRIVYSLAHPMVAFYANVHLRRRLRKGIFGKVADKICCRFNGIDDEGKFVCFAGDGKAVMIAAGSRTQYETNAHFNQLAEMWAAQMPKPEGGAAAPYSVS